MNDQVLNWLIGTTDITSQSAAGQTQISLDVKTPLLDIAITDDNLHSSDQANDEDNSSEKRSACMSRYDLMSDKILSHIKKSQNLVTAIGKTNIIKALTRYDSTTKTVHFYRVQKTHKELLIMVQERRITMPRTAGKNIAMLHWFEEYKWVTVVKSKFQFQLVILFSAFLIIVSRWSQRVSCQEIQNTERLHACLKNALTSR